MRKIIENNIFVILDVCIKAYLLYFIIVASHNLDKEVFSQVSYFRATILMFTGISVTAIGYYIFNFAKLSSNENKIIHKINALTLSSVSISSVIFFVLMVFYPTAIHFDGLPSYYSLFTLILLSSTMSQVLIYYVKAFSHISYNNVIVYLLITCVLLIVTYLLLAGQSGDNAYWVLSLYYTFNILYFCYLLAFKPNIENKLDFLKVTNPIDGNFSSFFIPNFTESLVSVPKTWIATSIIVSILGFKFVGEILIIQMLLGLFIFLCNSILMNAYLSISVVTRSESYSALERLIKPVRVLNLAMVFIVITLWDWIRKIFNINILSDDLAFLLISSTIIQSYLMAIGLIFKKKGHSKLTLIHNFIFIFVWFLSEWILLNHVGIDGYGYAFILSWSIIFILMIFQANMYQIVPVYKYTLEVISIIAIFAFLFWLFVL
ncbi:TPA: hypothetical protein ACGUXT_001219 [Vibrio vulnificus]